MHLFSVQLSYKYLIALMKKGLEMKKFGRNSIKEIFKFSNLKCLLKSFCHEILKVANFLVCYITYLPLS